MIYILSLLVGALSAQVPPMDQPIPVPTEIPLEAQLPTQPAVMTDPLLEGFFEDVQYNPTDKRDPFLPYLTAPGLTKQAGGGGVPRPVAPTGPLEPLQAFAVAQLSVVGIIWDVGRPRALIVDPTGKSHIIGENAKVGQNSGYVAAIREGEIIVVEELYDQEGRKSFQTQILRLVRK